MKSIFLLFFVLFIGTTTELLASEPMEVPPKLREIKSQEWYVEQFNAWRQRATESNNANAWINCYLAAKYSSQNSIDKIVKEAIANLKDGYEIELIVGMEKGFTNAGYEHILSAYQLNPDNFLTQVQLLLHYERLGLTDKRKMISQGLFDSRLIYQSLLNYSYNVLMSTSKNGYLLVDSDNTTIPLYILQDVLHIRKDVKIVNLELCSDQNYANLLYENFQIECPNHSNYSTTNWLKNLPSLNRNKEFYYALTLNHNDVKSIENELYVVGLAARRSNERLNNIDIVKKNIEQNFLMDYLSVDFNGEPQTSTGKLLEPNYLVPVLLLKRYYKKNGTSSTHLDNIIKKIAADNGRMDIVKNFLSDNQDDFMPFIPFDLDIKKLDESFKLIKGTLYAEQTEVTNEEYNDFLQYLADNNIAEVLNKSNIDLSAYESGGLAMMQSYHAPYEPTKKKKYFTQYPIINIPYAGAVAYCNWLTQQYNNNKDREHNKVKFRLPTLKEWQVAALGYVNFQSWELSTIVVKAGNDLVKYKEKDAKDYPLNEYDIKYPWYRFDIHYADKAKNSKGCYLGNFKVPQLVSCAGGTPGDGFTMTAPVASYFANDMKLYDVVGNVAEMISEKGKACGGSWNHPPEESTISSVNTYSGPDAAIGFRVFMEVLED